MKHCLSLFLFPVLLSLVKFYSVLEINIMWPRCLHCVRLLYAIRCLCVLCKQLITLHVADSACDAGKCVFIDQSAYLKLTETRPKVFQIVF